LQFKRISVKTSTSQWPAIDDAVNKRGKMLTKNGMTGKGRGQTLNNDEKFPTNI